jgi:hypothetical protein
VINPRGGNGKNTRASVAAASTEDAYGDLEGELAMDSSAADDADEAARCRGRRHAWPETPVWSGEGGSRAG